MDAIEKCDIAEAGALVIFDGVCNLCETSVNFIVSRDEKGIFRFVPSQSELGNILQKRYCINTNALDTVALIRDGEVFTESEAFVQIFAALDGPWRLLGLARWVPRPVRNRIYRNIAKRRYAWFGQKDECLIPTQELKSRFLESCPDIF